MKQLARTPSDLGQALRQARRQKKLTQQELAVNSGIRQETISKLKIGSSGARLDTVLSLCVALELELLITDRSKGSTDFLSDTF